MTAQTVAQRQSDLRARRAMLGLTEVRGIYLPKDLHKELRETAASLQRKRIKDMATSATPPQS